MPGQETINQVLQLLLRPGFELFLFSGLLKIMFLIGFVIYILFATIVVRQVFMMTATIGTPLAPVLKIFALGYLALTIGVFLFVLVA